MSQCKASLALSLALLVKEYAKAAYSVNSERIEAFATGAWAVGGPCRAGVRRGDAAAGCLPPAGAHDDASPALPGWTLL